MLSIIAIFMFVGCGEGKTPKDFKTLYESTKSIGKDEQENEADYFAACILMPQHSFVRHYNQLKERGLGIVDIIDNLQAIFKTPRESVKRRIDEVC